MSHTSHHTCGDSSVCDALAGHDFSQSYGGPSGSPAHKKDSEMVWSFPFLPISQDGWSLHL